MKAVILAESTPVITRRNALFEADVENVLEDAMCVLLKPQKL